VFFREKIYVRIDLFILYWTSPLGVMERCYKCNVLFFLSIIEMNYFPSFLLNLRMYSTSLKIYKKYMEWLTIKGDIFHYSSSS